MVKILLISDLHLGLKEDESLIPHHVRLKTFTRLTQLAKSYDVLLIAGDLFDNTEINQKTIDFVSSEFNNLTKNGVHIIYTLGENELNKTTKDSIFSQFNISKLFSDTENFSSYTFSKEEQNIHIYGLPANSKVNISEIKKSSAEGFHIALFHVDFNYPEESKKANIFRLGKEDFLQLNLDFYALGHQHQFKLFKSHSRFIGAYPGSPEATSFNEKGDRYALSIFIKDNEINQIKRLTVNSLYLNETKIDCSNLKNSYEIINEIEKKKSNNTILKIQLTGKRDFKIDYMKINQLKNDYFKLKIDDLSIPTMNALIDEYKNEESIRGEFFNLLHNKLKKNELPPDIDMDILFNILKSIVDSESYTVEDLLCT